MLLIFPFTDLNLPCCD